MFGNNALEMLWEKAERQSGAGAETLSYRGIVAPDFTGAALQYARHIYGASANEAGSVWKWAQGRYNCRLQIGANGRINFRAQAQ